MHILLFCAYPYPATPEEPLFCGGQYHPYHLSKAFAKQGVTVHVIARQEQSQPAYEVQQGITIHRYSSLYHFGGHRRGISFSRNRLRLTKKLLATHHFDWVMTFSPLTNELAVLQREGVKLFYMAPGVNVGYLTNLGLSPKSIARRLFIKWISQPFQRRNMHQAERIFANCSSDRALITDYYHPNIPIGISSNGVDTETFHPGAAEKHDTISFLTVGRFSPEKGHLEVLEALALLHRQGAAPQCTFVGFIDDGAYLRTVRQRIAELGLITQVTIRTNVAERDMPGIFAQSHVLIAYSNGYDPLPSVLFQALASGLPVLSTDWPARRTIVSDGQDGFLIPPRQPRLLAEKIQVLTNNRPMIETMGRAARKTACNSYDFKTLTADLLSHLN